MGEHCCDSCANGQECESCSPRQPAHKVLTGGILDPRSDNVARLQQIWDDWQKAKGRPKEVARKPKVW